MNIASNDKRIARNSAVLYIRMFVVMCIQLYISRVILRALGAEDYGIYNVVGGVVTIFSFLNGALGSATSRYFTFELGKKNFAQLRKVFCVAVNNHIAMAVIVLLLAETIGLWFLYEKLVIPEDRMTAALWVYQISIITAMMSLTQVPYTAAIIAHEKMDIYAYMGLADVALKLLLALSISFATIDKLVYYAISMFAIQIVSMSVYRFYCIKNYEECHFKFYKDRKLQVEMFQYASYDLIGSSSVMMQGQGLNLVLNMFTGPVVNAARAIAFQVEGAANQFANNFLTAVKPQVIKYYAQGNPEGMMRLVRLSSIFSFSLMLIIVIPLSLEMNTVLTLWLNEYPPYTATFTTIVLAQTTLNAFRNPRTTVFHATGNIKLSNIVTGTVLCMSLPIGYVMMRLGCSPISVFLSTLGCTIVADITNLLVLKRYVRYSISSFLAKVHFKCFLLLIGGLACAYPVHYHMEEGIVRFFVVLGTTALSLSIYMWVFIIPQKIKNNIVSKIRTAHDKL